MPGTPWNNYCLPKTNLDHWCTQGNNWCQQPWCYVDSACPTAVPSSVFAGSTVAHYSYDTCDSTPDCFTGVGAAPGTVERVTKTGCPYAPGQTGFYTAHVTCANGWTDAMGPVPAPVPASASPSASGTPSSSTAACPSCAPTDTDSAKDARSFMFV